MKRALTAATPTERPARGRRLPGMKDRSVSHDERTARAVVPQKQDV